MVVPLVSELGRQRQADCCEFQDSQGYTAQYKPIMIPPPRPQSLLISVGLHIPVVKLKPLSGRVGTSVWQRLLNQPAD